jgi:hypothetical protein
MRSENVVVGCMSTGCHDGQVSVQVPVDVHAIQLSRSMRACFIAERMLHEHCDMQGTDIASTSPFEQQTLDREAKPHQCHPKDGSSSGTSKAVLIQHHRLES